MSKDRSPPNEDEESWFLPLSEDGSEQTVGTEQLPDDWLTVCFGNCCREKRFEGERSHYGILGDALMTSASRAFEFVTHITTSVIASYQNESAVDSAAYGLANGYQTPILYIAGSLSVYLVQIFRKTQPTNVRALVHANLIISLLGSAASMLFLVFVPMLNEDNAEIRESLSNFLYESIWGIPAIQMGIVLQRYCYGAQLSEIPLTANLLNALLQGFLSYLFSVEDNIFHISGNLGAKGLGLANTISAWIMLTYLLIRMFLHKIPRTEHELFQLSSLTELRKAVIETVEKAYMVFFTQLCEFGAQITLTTLISNDGKAALDAQQVVSQYLAAMYAFILGFSITATPKISGAKNNEEKSRYGNAALSILTSINTAFLIATLTIPKTLSSLLIHDPHSPAHEILRVLLPVGAAGSSLAEGFRKVLTANLRGLNDNAVSGYINIGGIVSSTLAGALTLLCLGIKFDIVNLNALLVLAYTTAALGLAVRWGMKITQTESTQRPLFCWDFWHSESRHYRLPEDDVPSVALTTRTSEAS